MVAPLVPLVGRVVVSSLAKAAKNAIKKRAKAKGALKAKNAKVHKKIDADKAAKKNKKITYPSREQREIRKQEYLDKVGPKPTKEMINKAGPVKITKFPKTNKPTDPYGAPMRMVDKRTVNKLDKELTPADWQRLSEESLKPTFRQPRTEPRLEPRTEPRAIDKVLYKKPKN